MEQAAWINLYFCFVEFHILIGFVKALFPTSPACVTPDKNNNT